MFPHPTQKVPIFDLDGTLLDSDAPLVAAFVALGVPEAEISFGHVVGEECARLGIPLTAYLDAYDASAARPFPGVADLLQALPRWALCSNKAGRSGQAELARLGWRPEAALFSEDFGGPKRLEPVLAALGIRPAQALFVGDTEHDRSCAELAGIPFVWAGWNGRTAAGLTRPSQKVAWRPVEVLGFLDE